MLTSTLVLIGTVTPFALPPLVPILLGFYFLYRYFQARTCEDCIWALSITVALACHLLPQLYMNFLH